MKRRDQRSAEAVEYRALYKTSAWQRRRLIQLSHQPLCQWCLARGQTTAAIVAHHAEPHKGDPIKFNHGALVSLCSACHDREAQSIERLGYSKEVGKDGWPIDSQHPANVR